MPEEQMKERPPGRIVPSGVERMSLRAAGRLLSERFISGVPEGRRDGKIIAQGKRSTLGNLWNKNSPFSGLPRHEARQTRKGRNNGKDLVPQGGSRCAPLPWAILMSPLRGFGLA